MCLIPAHMEGGAIVHYQGLYYAIGSALTGWAPNPNKYATAHSLEGPWSEFKDIAPPETKTYGSQSTMLLKVVGYQEDHRHFHGRHLEAADAMGFALPVDAAGDRRRQAVAARTEAMDAGHCHRRGSHRKMRRGAL